MIKQYPRGMIFRETAWTWWPFPNSFSGVTDVDEASQLP
jgi:hypothetical protein